MMHCADQCGSDQIPDGVFLVQVQRVRFRRQAPKPYYTITLDILEPSLVRRTAHFQPPLLQPESRKLNWFLRDFGYDTELSWAR